MSQPIFLIGFMGSGKSTTGKKLATFLKYSFIDLDEMIENKYRISIPSLFSRFDENAFRIVEQQTLKETLNLSNHVIATGGGTPCYFNNMELMNAHGTTVYLKLHSNSLHQRLMQSKKKRPLIEENPKEKVLDYINDKLSERENYYKHAHIIFMGESIVISELAKEIRDQKPH